MILTKAEFAARLGVDRAQPTRWCARGMPQTSDGRIPVTEAEAWLAQHVDSRQRRRRSVGARTARMMASSPAPTPASDELASHLDPEGEAYLAGMIAVAEGIPCTVAMAVADAGAGAAAARAMFDRVADETRLWLADLLDEAELAPPPGCRDWREAALPAAIEFLPVSEAELADAAASAAPPPVAHQTNLPPRTPRGRSTTKGTRS